MLSCLVLKFVLSLQIVLVAFCLIGFFFFPLIGRCDREGDGTPLQYSCLENPMDGELGKLRSMGSLRVGHD